MYLDGPNIEKKFGVRPSQSAVLVFQTARLEALRLEHNSISPTALLLGLMGTSPTKELFGSVGISLDETRQVARKLLDPHEGFHPGKIGFATHTRAIISEAALESLDNGPLLIALLKVEGSFAVATLRGEFGEDKVGRLRMRQVERLADQQRDAVPAGNELDNFPRMFPDDPGIKLALVLGNPFLKPYIKKNIESSLQELIYNATVVLSEAPPLAF